MELSTREVEIAGIASSPSGLWMNQVGRNLTDAVDGLVKGKRYLIHDRDPLFTAEFLSMLAEGRSGCCLSEASTSQSQFERALGTVCMDDQGMSG
jgi:hypothetical protein